MNTEEILSFLLSKVEIFKGFTKEHLASLVKSSRITTFEPNEAIIEYGEEGRFMGVLLDGRAEVSANDNLGGRHTIAELTPGELFGEMSLMTGNRTVADIIGITRCRAILISQDDFGLMIASHPSAIQYLSRLITRRAKDLAYDDKERKRAETAHMKSGDPYGLKLKSEHAHRIMVINCGSSSLKYSLFDTENEEGTVRGVIENIGGKELLHVCKFEDTVLRRGLGKGNYSEAFRAMVKELERLDYIKSPADISVVGHRVVHGGEKFTSATVITDEVVRGIQELSQLAPLHNPINVIGIDEARKAFPAAQHVAVFDTTFHHTLPPYAYLYGLPYEYYEKDNIRRYGFHGPSHFYVALKAAQHLERPFNELEIVTCHLGNGASMCAVDHGRSVDTTMGLTPTAGLMMGTRCGDIDPGLISYLMQKEEMSPQELDDLINRHSGLKGLSGVSRDMRELEVAAENGNHRSLLTIKTFAYQVRKFIGSYVAAMQGLDCVVFTGGIGENSPGIRSLACQGLRCMGIEIDESKNRDVDSRSGITDIALESSPIRVLVIPTDEERMIARESLRAVERVNADKIISSQAPSPIPIEISAHHVHLCQEHVEILFGQGHHLTVDTDLSQPGQFACREKVDLIGPKGKVPRVRVLGPTRSETQVEIAMTEQFKLGLHPPIRESGDLEGTPGITLEGPAGSLTIDHGVICALRHVHMAPEDALRLGLRDRYVVRIRVDGDREMIFGDVIVRVSPKYALALHLDTDEGNAADVRTGAIGFVDGIQSKG